MKSLKELLPLMFHFFFPIESTPESVLQCSFCVSALFSQISSRSWQMTAHTEAGSAGGSFLLEGSFPVHCRYMHTQCEGLLQSQCKQLSKSLARCNLLGFLR
ncbi:hypothetical protein AMECASPLE_029572 [Ameca splendens]|uniref:Secreted protein n=1 Tax=Ameca splendens TaxID=208324 RepID=A0ABV1ACZ2_9TELE